MELLEQVHREESQQAVLGCADGIALIASGDGLVLLLVGPVAGIHCPPLPADPVWGPGAVQRAFVWQAIGGRVPASPGVSLEKLPTAMLHPVEPLHLTAAVRVTMASSCRGKTIEGHVLKSIP